MRTVQLVSLGTLAYDQAYQLQKQIFERVRKEDIPDTLLTVEHPHVYTLTKQTKPEHLLWDESIRKEKGIRVFETDRGGDITYHGFGQFVAYPILNMNHFYKDVHRYLRDLEQVVINLLSEFGIEAGRKRHPDPRKNYTGVWVGEEKICAIGVRFSSWTTMHGLALNVNTNLHYFEGIVPCGIMDKGVTSLAKILQREVPLSYIESLFVKHFSTVFGVAVQPVSQQTLAAELHRMESKTFSTSL
ncbi:MAG: lipoyl(octanoyl) transferase LipB [Chloroherpetonaceae bacterium]|nr:lipoyl(octanoyl) transferase LipB [Chloroherpetonaceae bacterium]MDW8020864.1 lipoyl(octanoyl) transferase LipB [Chloroherpetonaceae bacterium]